MQTVSGLERNGGNPVEEEIAYTPKRVNRFGRVLIALVVATSDLQGLTRRQHITGVPTDMTGEVTGGNCTVGERHFPQGKLIHFTD